MGGQLKYLLPLPLVLTGCVIVEAGDQNGRVRTSKTHIGIARIVTSEVEGAISIVESETLGLGWDNGPFLGWHSGSWIRADPTECQLVVVVRSRAQADNAVKVIEALEGQSPCIADFTGDLAQAQRP